MARKIDLSQIRKAKANQYKPGETIDLSADKKEGRVEVTEKKPKKKTPVTKAKPKPVAEKIPQATKAVKKAAPKKPGRPVDTGKKPTRATSVRMHPDLVEVPKILAGVSRKNVFTIYNEMIIDALQKYQKKYPGFLDDLKIPPKHEI